MLMSLVNNYFYLASRKYHKFASTTKKNSIVKSQKENTESKDERLPKTVPPITTETQRSVAQEKIKRFNNLSRPKAISKDEAIIIEESE